MRWLKFIRNVTDQVLNVLMFKSFQQLKATDFSISTEMEEAFLGRVSCNNKNNQFAIVEYENHKAAAVARRILIPKYGHILAIDWAVPTRERKRYNAVNGIYPAVERPLSVLKETKALSPIKTVSKVIPIPVLVVQPSPLDNVPFMSKSFHNIVKFFKYLLSISLYKSVSQREISFLICKEIEKKIVNRITNLENCSVAIQFIYNFLFWHAESKNQVVNPHIQKLLEEIKGISDLFVEYVNRRQRQGLSQYASEDNYFCNVLPVHLNVLFRIILRCNWNDQAKLTESIGKSLQWLFTIMQGGDSETVDFVSKIFKTVERESSASLDKATAIAKSFCLIAVTDEPYWPSFSEMLAEEIRHTVATTSSNEEMKNDAWKNMENWLVAESGSGDCGNVSFHMNSYPSVPVLPIEPSIMNKVQFAPDIFNNVLLFFKYIIKVCVNVHVLFLKIPQQIYQEIDKKIISQISGMENCSKGVEMITTYFSGWNNVSPGICSEAQNVLVDLKIYADSFVKFAWQKTFSGNQPLPHVEEFFCKTLPLLLNILFQLTLMLNAETPLKFAVNISKGLNWLQRGDPLSKQLIKEITCFILDPSKANYDLMKATGDNFFMQSNKEVCGFQDVVFPTPGDVWSMSKPPSPRP